MLPKVFALYACKCGMISPDSFCQQHCFRSYHFLGKADGIFHKQFRTAFLTVVRVLAVMFPSEMDVGLYNHS